MLRTDYLYYFLAVAQTKSINAAALELNITPPAISHALKKLESDLNLTLLTRTSKGVALTEEGFLVANKVRKIVADLDDLENLSKQLVQERQEKQLPRLEYLTLFSESSLFDSQLPSVSRRLYEKFPELDLIVAERPLPKTVKELSNDPNAVALLLIGNDSLKRIRNNWDTVETRSIASFSLQLIANKNSKWLPQNAQDGLTFEIITQLPLIKASWISSTQYTLDALTSNHNYNYVAVAPTLSVLDSFLSNDIGVCLGCEIPFMNPKTASVKRTGIPIISEHDLHIEYCLLYNKHLPADIVEIIYASVQDSYKESVKYAFK